MKLITFSTPVALNTGEVAITLVKVVVARGVRFDGDRVDVAVHGIVGNDGRLTYLDNDLTVTVKRQLVLAVQEIE